MEPVAVINAGKRLRDFIKSGNAVDFGEVTVYSCPNAMFVDGEKQTMTVVSLPDQLSVKTSDTHTTITIIHKTGMNICHIPNEMARELLNQLNEKL